LIAEKADVGGSTPSLATIIIKNLAESRLALPVRFQSAPVRGAVENRSEHCHCRSTSSARLLPAFTSAWSCVAFDRRQPSCSRWPRTTSSASRVREWTRL